MVKTVERTAVSAFTLGGATVKPGQVVALNRKQFNALVAAGCIHADDDENDAVPKLSLPGTVGTVIADQAAAGDELAGNASHHNGTRLSGDAADGAQLLADAAELERKHLEAGIEADAARARDEAAARLEADKKATAEAEAAEARRKAEADAAAKEAADAAAKLRTAGSGAPAVKTAGAGGPLTNRPV